MTPAPARINKNSRVMFRNRVQKSTYPMVVDDVRNTSRGRECKIDGYWWRESNLILHIEWLELHPETVYR